MAPSPPASRRTSPQGGRPTTVALRRPDGTTAATWTPGSPSLLWLRIVTSGTTITVYTDDGSVDGSGYPAVWTQLGQVAGETQNQAEVGAGNYHDYGVGTSSRYLDFWVA